MTKIIRDDCDNWHDVKNLSNKDLSKVEKVIISHFHGDHTGGLVKLRNSVKDENPKAFSTVYVAEDFFVQRYDENGSKKGFIGTYNDVDDFIESIITDDFVLQRAESILKELDRDYPFK